MTKNALVTIAYDLPVGNDEEDVVLANATAILEEHEINSFAGAVLPATSCVEEAAREAARAMIVGSMWVKKALPEILGRRGVSSATLHITLGEGRLSYRHHGGFGCVPISGRARFSLSVPHLVYTLNLEDGTEPLEFYLTAREADGWASYHIDGEWAGRANDEGLDVAARQMLNLVGKAVSSRVNR